MSDKPARKPNIGWVVFVLALGMLIWVRLRIVTDIPRSAYAEPRHSTPAAPLDAPSEATIEASADLDDAAIADRIAGHADSTN